MLECIQRAHLDGGSELDGARQRQGGAGAEVGSHGGHQVSYIHPDVHEHVHAWHLPGQALILGNEQHKGVNFVLNYTI